ncbi:helix-turn-helix domain-containing protein [Saccharothrix sp. BKS2]|uniref:helix-turn-helix domain-containing protein n=1 Tax=Saccharothrix sp. BKS2 TaxID=3064400 RepID=UPI0039ECE1F3
MDESRRDEHPVREALLELLRTRAELTSAQAARELGGNTGLYSFHLRKLAEQGLVEDVPGVTGRARPWRLARGAGRGHRRAPRPRPAAERPAHPDLGGLNRALEDESYQRWLDRREEVPAHWRRDEAFSQVVYLTPEEMAALGDAVRSLIALFRHREDDPSARPTGSEPVAVVTRLFPMLDPGSADDAGPQHD